MPTRLNGLQSVQSCLDDVIITGNCC
uniref:Uncharacterized protein n=1 Tax=Anguilla anguilla TaxID=7936 RepID=A0A0E9QYY7_ANGAN